MLNKVAFTMYPVEDMERAKLFYKTNLGLIPSQTAEEEKWIEFDLPQGGCFAITTLAEGLKPGATSGGRIAFEVENLDELTARLKENNVHFELDTVSFPVCRMAIILDSEGNAIILHELKNR